MLFSQQSLVSKTMTKNNPYDREVNYAPINFQSSIAKFMQISDQEIEQRNAMKRSRQAVIAGRLLRIRAEMKKLDSELKTNEQ